MKHENHEADQSRVVGVPSDRPLGSTASDIRLLRRVLDWAEARRDRLALRRQMQVFRCEFVDNGDYETGDMGTPLCYRAAGPIDEWCEPCQKRNALYNDYSSLRRIEKGRFYALCSLLDRREKAQTTDAVDPVTQPSTT